MTWPQFFDGKFFKTEFAARFNVQGIPSTRRFDREGKVISTDTSGPKLEAEVKRLLGL